MNKKFAVAVITVVLLGLGAFALAVPSCTNWMKQANGTYWRTCVDDNGNQYCEQTVDLKTVTRVKCQ